VGAGSRHGPSPNRVSVRVVESGGACAHPRPAGRLDEPTDQAAGAVSPPPAAVLTGASRDADMPTRRGRSGVTGAR